MKKKKTPFLRLQIPEPCHQPYDKMHSLPDGRYCEKCEKTVVDFTNISDGELVRIFQKHQGRICGVFRGDQLNRYMPLPMPIEKNRNWKMVAAFASAMIFGNVAAGQTKLSDRGIIRHEMLRGEVAPSVENDIKLIKGKVMDENREALIGATILLGPNEGTVSDIDGFFEIKIPKHLNSKKITVSYTGFEKQEVIWEKEKNDFMEIIMKVKTDLLSEVTVVGYGITRYKGGPIRCYATVSEDKINADSRSVEIEEEIEMELPDPGPTLEVFPNPFVSKVSVKIESEKPDAFLFHLYNESGQLLFAETHELEAGIQSVQLDLNKNNLPEGIYFLRISDSVGEIKTKKIVKMRP